MCSPAQEEHGEAGVQEKLWPTIGVWESPPELPMSSTQGWLEGGVREGAVLTFPIKTDVHNLCFL